MWEMCAQELGWNNVASIENNRYASGLLKTRFPNHEHHTDARTTDFRRYRGIVHVATFSPPCQPFSSQGDRRGADDPRDGLPVCLRALDECRPWWAVVENVPGLLTLRDGLVLRDFLRSMESLGYFPVVLTIPSSSTGAAHLRYRVWVVAHADKERRKSGAVSPFTAFQEKGWGPKPDNLAYATRLATTRKAALLGIYDGLPSGLDIERANRISLMGNAADPRIIRRILKAIDCAIKNT